MSMASQSEDALPRQICMYAQMGRQPKNIMSPASSIKRVSNNWGCKFQPTDHPLARQTSCSLQQLYWPGVADHRQTDESLLIPHNTSQDLPRRYRQHTSTTQPVCIKSISSLYNQSIIYQPQFKWAFSRFLLSFLPPPVLKRNLQE